jgi:hypothetical protein
LRDYLARVDDQLLELPWRQRQHVLEHLAEHLREDPDTLAEQSPEAYAEVLREEHSRGRDDLPGGMRSFLWPSPREWVESWVRGIAVVWVAALLVAATTALVDVTFGYSTAPRRRLTDALTAAYPTPSFLGSHRAGLILALPLSWLVGQYLTLRLLQGHRERRRTLHRLTHLAVTVMAALYGLGFLMQR